MCRFVCHQSRANILHWHPFTTIASQLPETNHRLLEILLPASDPSALIWPRLIPSIPGNDSFHKRNRNPPLYWVDLVG